MHVSTNFQNFYWLTNMLWLYRQSNMKLKMDNFKATTTQLILPFFKEHIVDVIAPIFLELSPDIFKNNLNLVVVERSTYEIRNGS